MANKAVIVGPELDFARAMEVEQIPEKLRCAICNHLAVNPLKLACCDTSVCGDCHESQSATECPVCAHSPFDKDTAMPSKALQTTVKVFLKTEAKKRGIDLKTGEKIVATPPKRTTTEEADTPAAEPASVTPANGESEAVVPIVGAAPSGEAETPAPEQPSASNGESAQAVETSTDEARANGEQEDQEGDDESDDDDDVVITTERPEQDEEQQHNGGVRNGMQHIGQENADHNMQADQQRSFGGFDQNMNGFGNNANFGNMNMMGQMMGMPGFGGMGIPNMMGLPNMGMDPSMMFGGNFGGMDMSAMMSMGMGMGMGGMNGGMAAAGMSDFNGMGGPGFFPNQGNYQQTNAYGNGLRNQHSFNDRGYGRGYGRGFGRGARGNQFGRGRGGWGFQQQYQHGQNQQSGPNPAVRPPSSSGANAIEVAPQRRASPTYDAGQGPGGTASGQEETSQGTVAAHGDQDATEDTNHVGTNGTDDNADHVKQNGDADLPSQDPQQDLAEGETSKDATERQYDDDNKQIGDGSVQVDSFDQSGAYNDFDNGVPNQQQYGRGQHASNGSRSGFRGVRAGYGNFDRGTESIVELTPAPAPPANAPSGPKAMREGRPNTGWAGRQTAMKPTPTPAPEVKAPSQPPETMHMDDIKQEEPVDDRSRSQSRSGRDTGREATRVAEDDYESEEAYARRKERERRKRKERDERYVDERNSGRDADKSSKKYRSRSESRGADSSRRRHRDKDDEHRSSRSRRERSKDRHHRRHRSKSPAREPEVQDDYSRRKSRGERDEYDERKESRRSSHKNSKREDDYYEDERKDRSHHRSSKHDRPSRDERPRAPEPVSVIVQPDDDTGFKIKGRKKLGEQHKDKPMPPPSRDRRSGVAEQSIIVPVSSDPYAAERARAQQGREAKEALRRQSTQSSSLGKRSRDEEEINAPRGPKGDIGKIKKSRKERRIGYKYEDEVGVDERDRDARRWRRE